MTELSKDYIELLTQVQPAPIDSKKEYERQLKWIDRIMMAEGSEPACSARIKIVDLLTMTVMAWEAKASPEPEVSPRAMLVHSMEAKGLSKSKLADELGVSRQLVGAIVNGERLISREMAVKLADYFDDPIEFYIDRSSRRVA